MKIVINNNNTHVSNYYDNNCWIKASNLNVFHGALVIKDSIYTTAYLCTAHNVIKK